MRKSAGRFLLLIFAMCPASLPASPLQESERAPYAVVVEGKVRDASGKPIAGASVSLIDQIGGESLSTKTNAEGDFQFLGIYAGKFIIKAEKAGWKETASGALELAAGEKRKVSLVMEAKGSAADDMPFADQPDFTIAGVTDWSNYGVHGSTATTRTSDALAKETAALKAGAAHGSAANGNGDAAVAHRLAGERCERLGDPVAAVHEYEQAARLDPSEENYFAWGSELLLHRATQPATEVFERGLALHPKSARMLAGLGAALYANGQFDEAARRLCEASDSGAGDFAPYLFLGKMEETATNPFPCGEEKLARFAKEQPGNALANYYYALSLARRGREAESPAEFGRIEELLEKAVSIDPKLGEAYVQLGILYLGKSDFAKATTAFKRATEANPHLCAARYRLGQTYKHTGEEAKAQQEIAIYKQCEDAEAKALERERRELRQFLVILKDQPAASQPH